MDTKILENIGLTYNESLVYLTLLKIGTSKTGKILTESGLNSGKIYEILDSLEKKGLVSESIIDNVKYFTPAPPSQIIEYLEQKKAKIQEEEQEIKKIIPNLELLKKTQYTKIKAITYMGFRGIKTASDEALDLMKKGDEILAMGVTERKNPKFNEFWLNWSYKRIRKRVIAKHIFSEKSSYFQKFKKMKYTKVRLLKGITPVTIDIFGQDKVLILNYNETPSCTLIYDKNTAISFVTFFNQLWKLAR